MSLPLVREIENALVKPKSPSFQAGDLIRVHLKIVEADTERIQPFEGIVLRRRGGGLSQTFSVRKISFGVGIERNFPLHSPRIEKIEVLRRGKARRARLYYLRSAKGKAGRIEIETTPSHKEARGKDKEAPESSPKEAIATKT